MKAFRVLALGYAILTLLIAPAWLAADEQVLPAGAEQAVEETKAAAEPVLDAASDAAAGDELSQQPTAPDDEPEGSAQQDEGSPPPDEPPTADDGAREPRGEPEAVAAQSGSVTIRDFEFSPATITVNVGDTVTWTNEGPAVHTATAEDGSFDTGNLQEGESGSATFNEPGTIAYICTPHPFMKGRVVVRAASADSPGGGSDSTGTGIGTGDTTAGGVGGTEGGSVADDGSRLPATGFEALMIGLLGLVALAAGLLLRRRAEPE